MAGEVMTVGVLAVVVDGDVDGDVDGGRGRC
jgi:hypothetical protein